LIPQGDLSALCAWYRICSHLKYQCACLRIEC
jgi:hypothetical protein